MNTTTPVTNEQLFAAMNRLASALTELRDALKTDSPLVAMLPDAKTPQSTGNSILLATRRAG